MCKKCTTYFHRKFCIKSYLPKQLSRLSMTFPCVSRSMYLTNRFITFTIAVLQMHPFEQLPATAYKN